MQGGPNMGKVWCPFFPFELGVHRPWRRRSGRRSVDGGEDLTHPYLACQMSDYGFHKPLRGLNSRVRAEISTYPACLLAILTA